MLLRYTLKLKRLAILPFKLVAYTLVGIAGVILVITQSIDDIGRNHYREDHAGTYDFKYDDGLGVKELY